MLGSVDWWLVTEVSAQPVGPIFKGQAVQEEVIILTVFYRHVSDYIVWMQIYIYIYTETNVNISQF